MAYLNVSTPRIYCLIRREFMFDMQDHHGETEEVELKYMNSIPGQAICFTCLTRRGVQFTRVPLHAFVHKPDAPRLPLGALELWDCFSYYVSMTQPHGLRGMPCKALLRGHGWERGKYVMTFDWCAGDSEADLTDAEDPEHKSAHVLQLDNGCFAALPNNRIIWLDPAFVDDPLDIERDGHPGYRTQSRTWSVERDWHVEPTEAYYYGVTSVVDSGCDDG